jgi:23S rRNA pseudouridine2605 synthase
MPSASKDSSGGQRRGGAAKKTAGVRSDGTARRTPHRDAGRTGGYGATGRGVAPARTPTNRPAAATPRRAATGGGAGDGGGAGAERLQKVLATAGIGSRRACEELIAAGRVTVDGRLADLGDRADPATAVIHVDGERIVTDATRVYLAINKPAGVVSTMADEKGRAALADYLGNVPQRVYHVGRLDQDSEGLLLLTNDGTLAHKLMHPSYNVPKTYLAEVSGPVRPGLRKRLMEGVELDDGPVAVDAFRVVDQVGGRVLVEVVLHEGRKHIVRRLLTEVGHPVSRLVRTAIGPIKIGDLKSGRTRRLGRAEVAALFAAVGE